MPLLGGLGAALGGFGRSIISRLQKIGQSVASALRLGKAAGVEVEPAAVAREWGEVKISREREEQFAFLVPEATIPVEWYAFSEIPWDKPIAYRFRVYGRDLATGQFVHQTRDLTLSRPVTVGEAEDIMKGHLGQTGASPMYEIFSLKLIGGSRRLGEEWRR